MTSYLLAISGTEIATMLVAAVAAISGVVATARQRSGQAVHTDAQVLWAEAKSLRDGYRGDVEDQRIEIAKLNLRIRDLEAEAAVTRRQVALLETRHADCEAQLAALRDR